MMKLCDNPNSRGIGLQFRKVLNPMIAKNIHIYQSLKNAKSLNINVGNN